MHRQRWVWSPASAAMSARDRVHEATIEVRRGRRDRQQVQLATVQQRLHAQ
jgi:hypothetical protein